MLPPAWFAGPLLVGLRISRQLPLPFAPRRWRWAAGVWLVAMGAALMKGSIDAMREAGESPEPWEPTTSVVDRGVYRHSRNPIYIAYGIAYAGAALLLNSLAALLLLPVVFKLVTRFVVEPEERLLQQLSPEEYAAYAEHTPRWML